jgi:hypothetical protein
MTIGFPIVAAGAVAKCDFAHQSFLFQIAQRVIDGGKADRGHQFARGLEYLGRGWVRIAGPNHIKHRLALTRQGWLADLFRARICLVTGFHTWNYNYSNLKVKPANQSGIDCWSNHIRRLEILAGKRSTGSPVGSKLRSMIRIPNWRSVITLGLVAWCAGAGCLLVTAAKASAMGEVEPVKVTSSASGWSQTSGSVGAHDCCKARHANKHHAARPSNPFQADAEGISQVPDSNAMSCCPLTSGTLVVNGRQRIGYEDTSSTRHTSIEPVVAAIAASAAFTPVRLDQNQTYLRGCVFLI